MVQVIPREECNSSAPPPRRSSANDSQRHVEILNVGDALDYLRKAVSENNQSLGKQCIEYLDNCISNKSNLLPVLLQLSSIVPPDNSDNYRPSAPPPDRPSIEYWVQVSIQKLRTNILLEIDKHADFVLKQKEFCDLCYDDVYSITTRDTLYVSNETLVYVAVIKWAEKKIIRDKLGTEQFLSVLDMLRYAPRYGLMTEKQFLVRQIQGIKGPDRISILQDPEINEILKVIRRVTNTSLPYSASERRVRGDARPHHLSNRSKMSSRESSPTSTCSKTKPGERVLINFLSCFTAVFD